MTGHILLYDCERDGDIKPGEAILVFEDGKTKRVREKSLYGKEQGNGTITPRTTSVVRTSIGRSVGHNQRKLGLHKARKAISMR